MSLRVKSVLDLHQSVRDQVRLKLADLLQPPKAAAAFRLELLREERERLVLGMLAQLRNANLAMLFEREYRFNGRRQWRLDLYARGYRLGIELHGGLYKQGRHVRAKGFIDDREKMNAAIECGIRVLEYWPKAIADGSAVAQIERIVSQT